MGGTAFRLALALAASLAMLIPAGLAHAASPEQRVLDGIDSIRAKHGLPALRDSGPLGRSARSQSRSMLAMGRVAHAPRLSAAGRWSLLGENIGMHWGWRPRAGWLLRAWMNSPVHRAIILSKRFRFAGVGMAKGRLSGRRATTWTLRLGRR